MADHSYLPELPERAEIIQPGVSILHEVLSRGVGRISGRSSRSPVIISKCSDSVPCKKVGDHQERLVAEQFLITVLEAASGYHQCHRDLFPAVPPFRINQGPGQDGITIGERNVFQSVRERRLRSLRTVPHELTRSKDQRHAQPPLRESSYDLAILKLPRESHVELPV